MNTNSPEFVSLLAAAIWWRDYATHLSEGRRVFPTSPYPALYQFTPAPPPGVAPQERAESGRIRLDPDAMPPETLDEFMLRHEGSKAPNSILRIAWATGKSIQEVVDDISSMDVSKPTAIGGLDGDE